MGNWTDVVVDMSNSSSHNITAPQPNYRFLLVTVCSGTVCITVNLCALCAVTKSKGLLSNYTLVNLYVSSFPIVIVGIISALNGVAVIELRGEWLCGIWSGFRRLSISILPVTVVAISLERFRLRQPQSRCARCTSALKVFVLTWTVAFFLSFPMIFTYKYVQPLKGKDFCKKILLLGSTWARMAYEGTYSILLHVCPSVYLVYDFHRLNFKLNYLFFCKRIPLGLEDKVRRLRLVFFYSASFIAVWLPFGAITFTKKVMEDVEHPEVESESPVTIALGGLIVLHLASHPLVYFYTHHPFSIYNLLNVCGCLSRVCPSEEDRAEASDVITSSVIRMETFNETKTNVRAEA